MLFRSVLPLLIGANFIEYPDNKFLNSIIKGKNTDFGEKWYEDVGIELVTVMMLFVFSPVIDFVTEWIELTLHRMYARKYLYPEDVHHDRNDFLKYLDLHAGPEYCFYSKCASTNFLVFFTIIFGTILPVLYPLAVFGILA